MSSSAASLLIDLVRTTLLLTGVGIAAALVFRIVRVQSPTLHRLAWCIALLAGWTFVRLPIGVPWYAAEPAQSQPIAAMPVELPELDDFAAPMPGIGADQPWALPETQAYEQPQETAFAAPQVAVPSKVTWQQGLIAAWMVGAASIAAWWVLAYMRFVWKLPRPLACRSEWQAEWLSLQAQQGSRRPIVLRVTESLGPLLCRLPRGAELLVPGELWRALGHDERLAILRHELAHHQRRDVWRSLAMRALALPHWFNPVAWLAVRRFDEAAEWACDRAAMGEEPTVYARMLLRLGELASTRAPLGSAMSNLPLTNRIRRLLTLETKEDSAMKRALLLSVLLLIVPLASVHVRLVAEQPEASDTPPPPETAPPNSATSIDPDPTPPKREIVKSPYKTPVAVRDAERKMVDSAKLAYEGTLAAYLAGNAPMESVITWSNRWLNAELAVAATRDDQRAAARGHLARMQERQTAANELAKLQSQGGEAWAVAAANYYVADAERRLAEIEATPEMPVIKNLFGPTPSDSSLRHKSTPSIAQPPFAVDKQELLYDGKTFDQWTAQLKTDLSPGLRKDAMFAMAEFAKNGHGPRVADLIFETVQNYPIGNMNNSLEIPVKDAAIYAASRIPANDLLPAIKQALQSENPNLRLFAILVLPLHDAKDQIIPLLLTAMNDKDSQVVTASGESFAYLDHDNADLVGWIRTSLTSGEAKNILPALFLAKGRMGRNGINARLRFRSQASLAPEIVALLDHPERAVRDAASSSLLWEDDDLRRALVELAASDAPQAANARKLVEKVVPKRSRDPAAKRQ